MESLFQLYNGEEKLSTNLLNYDKDNEKLTFEAVGLSSSTNYGNLRLSVNGGNDFSTVGSVETIDSPLLPEITNVSVDWIGADSFNLSWELVDNGFAVSQLVLTSEQQNFSISWNLDEYSSTKTISGLNPNSNYDDLVLKASFKHEGKDQAVAYNLDPITTISRYEYAEESFEVLEINEKSFTFNIEVDNHLSNQNIFEQEFVFKANNQTLNLSLKDYSSTDNKTLIMFEATNLRPKTEYSNLEISVNGGKDFFKISTIVETLESNNLKSWEIALIVLGVIFFLLILLLIIFVVYRYNKQSNKTAI